MTRERTESIVASMCVRHVGWWGTRIATGGEYAPEDNSESPWEDRSSGCVAQPSTYLFDRESGTFRTREQVVS